MDLSKLADPLMKFAMSLVEGVLLPIHLTAVVSIADGKIQKSIYGRGNYR